MYHYNIFAQDTPAQNYTDCSNVNDHEVSNNSNVQQQQAIEANAPVLVPDETEEVDVVEGKSLLL